MNKVKRLADLLNVIMYAFCVSIAGLFLLDATMNADQPAGLLLAGAFLILLVSYCLRAFVKKMPVFVGAHVLLFAVTIFVATLMNTPYTKAVAILWVIFCGWDAGKESYIFAGNMENAVYWARKGYDSITYSLDAAIFINACQELTAQFRRETGGEPA